MLMLNTMKMTNVFVFFYVHRVDPDTRVEDEPKFIPFYSKLLGLFSVLFSLPKRQSKDQYQ